MPCSDITIIKDPNARLDYVVDWAAWLAGNGADVLASADFFVAPAGLTISASDFTAVDATVWLSEGVAGVLYAVTCRITTGAGRAEDFSFRVRVREK